MKFKFLFLVGLLVLISFAFTAPSFSQGSIGIDEHLGDVISDTLVFQDEQGKKIRFGEILGKPIILTLIYFRCPGLCSTVLNALVDAADDCDLKIGKDYRMVSVSFDPSDTYVAAMSKKNNYMMSMRRKVPRDGWRFLTGDTKAIRELTRSVGFEYQPERNFFTHSAGLIFLSPKGKIVRYFNGAKYLPMDLKMGLVEAADGKIGSTINRVLQTCFSYDPKSGKYVLKLEQIVFWGVSIFGLVLVLYLTMISKKNKQQKDEQRFEGEKLDGK